MQAGGEHARMGTHNRLLRLGEKLYLEVIAANPAVPHPGRPRWFQLDEPDSVRVPRLATWAVRCDDIRSAAAASQLPLGKIEAMNRETFEWLLTVPEDGKLGLHGLAPALIQWQTASHPADTLKDRGCSLIRLEGFHAQPEKVTGVLKSIRFEGVFEVSARETPGLLAQIRTPSGPRQLR
jgi:hypothetical protein